MRIRTPDLKGPAARKAYENQRGSVTTRGGQQAPRDQMVKNDWSARPVCNHPLVVRNNPYDVAVDFKAEVTRELVRPFAGVFIPGSITVVAAYTWFPSLPSLLWPLPWESGGSWAVFILLAVTAGMLAGHVVGRLETRVLDPYREALDRNFDERWQTYLRAEKGAEVVHRWISDRLIVFKFELGVTSALALAFWFGFFRIVAEIPVIPVGWTASFCGDSGEATVVCTEFGEVVAKLLAADPTHQGKEAATEKQFRLLFDGEGRLVYSVAVVSVLILGVLYVIELGQAFRTHGQLDDARIALTKMAKAPRPAWEAQLFFLRMKLRHRLIARAADYRYSMSIWGPGFPLLRMTKGAWLRYARFQAAYETVLSVHGLRPASRSPAPRRQAYWRGIAYLRSREFSSSAELSQSAAEGLESRYRTQLSRRVSQLESTPLAPARVGGDWMWKTPLCPDGHQYERFREALNAWQVRTGTPPKVPALRIKFLRWFRYQPARFRLRRLRARHWAALRGARAALSEADLSSCQRPDSSDIREEETNTMSAKTIEVIQKQEFEFPHSQHAQKQVIAASISTTAWRQASLVVRTHSAQIDAGNTLKVAARVTWPSADEPTVDFTDTIDAGFVSLQAAPKLETASWELGGAYLQILLVAKCTSNVCKATVSAELILRP